MTKNHNFSSNKGHCNCITVFYSAEQVAASTGKSMSKLQQSATAAEEIAQIMADIATGANGQWNNTCEGTAELITLGRAIETI